MTGRKLCHRNYQANSIASIKIMCIKSPISRHKMYQLCRKMEDLTPLMNAFNCALCMCACARCGINNFFSTDTDYYASSSNIQINPLWIIFPLQSSHLWKYRCRSSIISHNLVGNRLLTLEELQFV